MSFISIEFLFLLIITIFVFYCLPVCLRKYFLLIVSSFFYIRTDIRLFIWLVFITIFNYIGGILIEKSGRKKVPFCFFLV